jgi:hypothetical protein
VEILYRKVDQNTLTTTIALQMHVIFFYILIDRKPKTPQKTTSIKNQEKEERDRFYFFFFAINRNLQTPDEDQIV